MLLVRCRRVIFFSLDCLYNAVTLSPGMDKHVEDFDVFFGHALLQLLKRILLTFAFVPLSE